MRVALAGGGTGGHLFPGLALAAYLRDRGIAGSLVFFGAQRGIEARLVPAAGYRLIAQPLEPLRGRNPLAAAGSLAVLSRAVFAARRELRRQRVDVVVGLGGYASAAAVVAARSCGVPVVLLEQNLSPGLANRLLARGAFAVCTSFAATASHFAAGKAVFTGNPVGAEIDGLRPDRPRDTLLVFGGSSGAQSLNRAVTTALGRLSASLRPARILHQAGAAACREVGEAYRNAGVEAEVVAFIDDMASAYRRARLAVCRAGATSVAELTATATPAILLPYPHAASAHQSDNAAALLKAGAALVVKDDEEAAEALERELAGLLGDPDRLDSMVRASSAISRPGAVARVAEVVASVVKDV